MKIGLRKTSFAVTASMVILPALLVALTACQSESGSPRNGSVVTTEITSGKRPNASVSGSATYRERLALTPGAKLEVQLRDTSLQDAAAPLIAQQVIENPGQVPIEFKVEYNRDDINSRNTYSIQARIVESDGRLAFTNDTAYDVITGGNPRQVDMTLVMVQPPPVDAASGEEQVDPNVWVEAEYPITGAEMLPPHEGDLLRIFFLQSNLEDCSRGVHQKDWEVDGNDIKVTITNQVPPPAPWAAPCHEDVVELDEIIDLKNAFTAGESYSVVINGQQTGTFTRPHPDFPDSITVPVEVQRAEIRIPDSAPPQYNLLVTYGIPVGSSCSHENGYAIKRLEDNGIEVSLTYHQAVPGEAPLACTADYPVREISIPLGWDFEPGQAYEVSINGEEAADFVAR